MCALEVTDKRVVCDTRNLEKKNLTASGAELKQHGRQKVSNETDAGTVTTDYRVLDVRRPIGSDR